MTDEKRQLADMKAEIEKLNNKISALQRLVYDYAEKQSNAGNKLDVATKHITNARKLLP